MSTFGIAVTGQDGRSLFAKVNQNGRSFKKRGVRVATMYPTANAADAAFVAPHPKARIVTGHKQLT